MNKYNILYILGLICILANINNVYAMEPTSANSNITLFPLSVEMGNGNNQADAVILNSSNYTATYLIDLIDIKVDKDGTRQVMDNTYSSATAVHNSAKRYLKISPRRIVLNPEEKQRIRLVYNPDLVLEEMKEGEYRSHLRVVKIEHKSFDDTAPGRNENGIIIKPKIHYALTIPVFLREGKLSYNAAISNMVVNNERNKVDIEFKLSGNKSVKGDLHIIYQNTEGEERLIKHIPGLSIYYPAEDTAISTSISLPKDIKAGSILKAIYRKPDNKGGNVISSFDYYL